MADDPGIRAKLLLSLQRGLLDNVPSALRSVTCGWEGTVLKIRFLFDGEIGEDDEESARLATTLVIADFDSPWTLVEEFERFDYPADLRSRALPLRAYARKETTTAGEPLR